MWVEQRNSVEKWGNLEWKEGKIIVPAGQDLFGAKIRQTIALTERKLLKGYPESKKLIWTAFDRASDLIHKKTIIPFELVWSVDKILSGSNHLTVVTLQASGSAAFKPEIEWRGHQEDLNYGDETHQAINGTVKVAGRYQDVQTGVGQHGPNVPKNVLRSQGQVPQSKKA